jgi:uncharacterized protein (DUF2236 family)
MSDHRQLEPQADHGLFGPSSVTWQIMTEPVMWVAGLRALYLQALHPRVMRGTWQNSSLARPAQAWGRFTRTVEFVLVRTYGSAAEAERAGRRLRRIHAALRGVDASGREFRLDEPELLLWVHCAEVSSAADIARRSGIRVSPARLDVFVAEQRRSAELVGLHPADVPASMADLEAYYEQLRPRLRACPEAWQALRASFTPPLPRRLLPLRLVVPPLNVLAFGSLPRWARQLYGTPGLPATDAAITAALRAVHESTALIPERLLFMPEAAAAARQQRRAA